jgi:hypothetical protein
VLVEHGYVAEDFKVSVVDRFVPLGRIWHAIAQ